MQCSFFFFFFFLMIRRPPRSTLFPSRRSSDLGTPTALPNSHSAAASPRPAAGPCRGDGRVVRLFGRSEEHTSELQSRLHLVCRLLLEKKKRYTLTDGQLVRAVM